MWARDAAGQTRYYARRLIVFHGAKFIHAPGDGSAMRTRSSSCNATRSVYQVSQSLIDLDE
jgi:hypothetical protein